MSAEHKANADLGLGIELGAREVGLEAAMHVQELQTIALGAQN